MLVLSVLTVRCVAGAGKTSTARVLAGRASLPLVYVPLESLVSKWYGESEQNMAKVRLAEATHAHKTCLCHRIQAHAVE
jgi:AAA+ superfamily predicted ATPase